MQHTELLLNTRKCDSLPCIRPTVQLLKNDPDIRYRWNMDLKIE